MNSKSCLFNWGFRHFTLVFVNFHTYLCTYQKPRKGLCKSTLFMQHQSVCRRLFIWLVSWYSDYWKDVRYPFIRTFQSPKGDFFVSKPWQWDSAHPQPKRGMFPHGPPEINGLKASRRRFICLSDYIFIPCGKIQGGGSQSRHKALIYNTQALPRAEFSDKPPLPVV